MPCSEHISYPCALSAVSIAPEFEVQTLAPTDLLAALRAELAAQPMLEGQFE